MKPPNLLAPSSVDQVASLLRNGGTSEQLEACEVLMDSLPAAFVNNLTHGQRVRVLRALLEKVLAPDNSDPYLGAAREYLGWIPHSYESVIKVMKESHMWADVEELDSGASEDEKRAHREKLMSLVTVRELWAGRRLQPPNGLTVRRVRHRRPEIAGALLRAFQRLIEDTSRVDALVRTISSQPPPGAPTGAEGESPKTASLDGDQPIAVGAGTFFTVLDSETLFVIGVNGRRKIYANRRIRSEIDGLDEFHDYYSGSGNPKVEYQFTAEYGCEVDVDSQTRNSVGAVSAKFKLSRPLARGAEHTIRYIIERRDPADEHEESKTWVLSFYTEEDLTLRERMLIRFDTDAPPSQAWWHITQSANRIPSEWSADHTLEIDNHGCVEWEPPQLKPNLHYVICWQV